MFSIRPPVSACLRRRPRLSSLALILAATGRVSPPVVSTVLFEDQDRLVRLDVTFREGGQEHSHPARVKSIRLARVLRAIALTPPGPLLPTFLGHHPLAGSPAFSEGDIEFLAPLFAEGLRRSTPPEHRLSLADTSDDLALLASDINLKLSELLRFYKRRAGQGLARKREKAR